MQQPHNLQLPDLLQGDNIEITGLPINECLFTVLHNEPYVNAAGPLRTSRLLVSGKWGEQWIDIERRGYRAAWQTSDGKTIRGPYGYLDI